MEGVRTSRNPIDLLRDTEESSISLRRLEMINLVCTETSSVSFDYMCCVHISCMLEEADKLDLSKPKMSLSGSSPSVFTASSPASWRRQPIPGRRPKDFVLEFLPPTIPICTIVLISIQRNEL